MSPTPRAPAPHPILSTHHTTNHKHPNTLFFFFNDTATTEIYTPFPTRRSSDLLSAQIIRQPVKAYAAMMNLPLPLPAHLDRKSTRLNSSHSQISYAVFCLKKKKNKDAFHSQ